MSNHPKHTHALHCQCKVAAHSYYLASIMCKTHRSRGVRSPGIKILMMANPRKLRREIATPQLRCEVAVLAAEPSVMDLVSLKSAYWWLSMLMAIAVEACRRHRCLSSQASRG